MGLRGIQLHPHAPEGEPDPALLRFEQPPRDVRSDVPLARSHYPRGSHFLRCPSLVEPHKLDVRTVDEVLELPLLLPKTYVDLDQFKKQSVPGGCPLRKHTKTPCNPRTFPQLKEREKRLTF